MRPPVIQSMAGCLYFHSPCFDGIVSAVLTLDYLKERQNWREFGLRAVNYDLKRAWLSTALEQPAAVVDFLYHPSTTFWADHHSTTFLTPDARAHFRARRGPLLIYDESADSCAGLIQRHLQDNLEYTNARLSDLVAWANKTDAARYDSVEEAVFGDAPALRISFSLSVGDDEHYPARIVRALHEGTLESVANSDEVTQRYALVRGQLEAGIERLRKNARLEHDGLAVFDVDASDVSVSRYAPYLLFPQARYSAGIVRLKDGAKVTAMRNPWIEFESVPLGPICAQLGGGGHHRVGSIALHGSDAERAPEILAQLVCELRRCERALSTPIRQVITSR